MAQGVPILFLLLSLLDSQIPVGGSPCGEWSEGQLEQLAEALLPLRILGVRGGYGDVRGTAGLPGIAPRLTVH